MAQKTAVQKAIEEIKSMAGEFENQRIPAVFILSKIIPLLEYEKEQTEISDEEIDKQAELIEVGIYRMFFKTGAKWYREQLKKK